MEQNETWTAVDHHITRWPFPKDFKSLADRGAANNAGGRSQTCRSARFKIARAGLSEVVDLRVGFALDILPCFWMKLLNPLT